MDLVKAGETAQVSILGETFHVKVMSIFETAEWAEKCTSAKDDTLVLELSKKIIKIDGFSEKPVDIMKKMRKAEDLVLIMQGIVSASGLGESEAKNLNSSSEQVTTNNSEVVEKIVDEVELPVSTTDAPNFQ